MLTMTGELNRPSEAEMEAAFGVLKHRADPERRLTSQQERYVFLRAQGLTIAQARNGAGYASTANPEKNAAVAHALAYFRQQEGEQIKVNRDKLTVMLFDSHAKAANSMEEIAAIRELGKLHDQYPDAKRAATQITVNVSNGRLEQMPDSELIKLSGIGLDDLTPEPLEGEAVRVLTSEGEAADAADEHTEPGSG